MISVTIKLHSAVTGKTKLLGRTLIWNRGDSDDPKKGNYGVAVLRKDRAGEFDENDQSTWHIPFYKNILRSAYVGNYPRLAYNVWRLVIRALQGAFPEEDQNGRNTKS